MRSPTKLWLHIFMRCLIVVSSFVFSDSGRLLLRGFEFVSYDFRQIFDSVSDFLKRFLESMAAAFCLCLVEVKVKMDAWSAEHYFLEARASGVRPSLAVPASGAPGRLHGLPMTARLRNKVQSQF